VHRVRELTVAGTTIVPVVDEGLGNSAYLADLGDGRALAVDVPRDLRAVRAAARRHGLSVAFAADTHLHADFLSGARQLASDDGVQVLASAAGGRLFGHRALSDGDEVDLGGLTLRAWATPGHTAEHVAFLLADGHDVLGVFTGGSLLVGAAARTDLAGPWRAEPLARAQYGSLRRLMTLPDDTMVYPTHGAGSFCSAPPGAERTTTIGRERDGNPLLAVPDEDAFVNTLLGSLGSFPPYFLRLAEQNRRGPAVLASAPALAALTARQVRRLTGGGAQVVDVRPVPGYAAGHIAGALAIPLRPAFATWLGWFVPDPGTPLIIVAEPGLDLADVAWQAANIGYENLAGTLAGGIAAWRASGQPVAVTPLITPGHVEPTSVVDVRQAAEYAGGHLPGARSIELGGLAGAAAGLTGRPVVTMCGHGERAATAASVLERAGIAEMAVLRGGPGDWARATGQPLEAGT
jgi:hydroxyacylglutathione hydrolase